MSRQSQPDLETIRRQNRDAWNALVARRQRFTLPATDDDVATSSTVVAADSWLDGSMAGKRLLCLAAGGGRQADFTPRPAPR